MFAVRSIEPATVPARRRTGEGNTATMLFAGMLNETVREPVENITIGSSVTATAFGVNESVRVPDSGAGNGADNAIPIACCCVGFRSTGTPVNVRDGKLLGLLITSPKV